MHLRTMTLQAIGPFAGTHTVDFDALSASGLFLLEGPTGSGKSTLIDAVVFALYGKVASAEASEDRLRSAYADPDVESFVDLTFEVGSGVFRVRRTPAYDRPKRRGEGTVRQQASVRLWRVSADSDAPVRDAVTRLDEAGLEIERAVGLSRAQFVQTIVLPQGEFATFLRANPEDRRGLLQKIFGTEVYERMQDRLAAMRAEANRAVEAARASVATTVAHFLGASGVQDDDLTGLDAAEVVARTDGHVEALSADAVALATTAAHAEAVHADAADRLEEARRVARLVLRRAELTAERAGLDERSAEHALDVERLARARAAAAVRGAVDGYEKALVDVGSAEKAVSAAVDAAPDEVSALLGAGDVLGRVRDARERALVAASGLARVVGIEAGLVAERHALREVRDRIAELRDEDAADAAWLEARPARRADLAAQRLGAATVAAAEPGLRARVDALAEVARRVVSLASARDELDAVAARTGALAGSAAAAIAHEAALRTARVAGLAGELASDLADGDPCPVCGASEHPAKAAIGADHVSADDVLTAEAARAEAERVLGQARAAQAALEERVEGLRADVGGATPESARAELVGAKKTLDAAVAAGAEVGRLDAELEAFDALTAVRAQERAAAAAQLAELVGRVDVEQQTLDAHEAEVLDARGGHPTVVARQSELDGVAAAAGTLVTALEEREDCERQLTVRRTELAAALSEHGFLLPGSMPGPGSRSGSGSGSDGDAEAIGGERSALDAAAAEAREAWLAQTALAALAEAVAAHVAAVERVRAGLADEEVAGLAPDAEPDVPGALERERDAAREATAARARDRVAHERAASSARAADAVRTAVVELDRASAAAGPVTRMAGLAAGTGGDNGKGLSLATYVLARRFEDVVAAANERLLVMSDGRYELARSDRKEDVASRRTGLAMRVVDHRTQQERDPRTLSGGESFYVSLCLALGMADVVTAEAGGIDLGTMFVDEGFGTLDPHTLDQVLAELGRLRAGGRVVGVVSHVDALKQAIADRIEVRPGPDGPSTLRVLAG
ncbi:AAA family ATPase [Cellulomonas sp. HZM]|uniref:AAA family ATPase n=1 Tax=Cellulomonas sp. HZM TaxID=1454010 RepID=UPI000493AF06|nr:SMC family ATPase [Cellulomonas sp. HZM]